MRKLLLFACALFGFMACTQNTIEEQSAIRTDAPETIRVGFEDDETRIQLNEAQKTVWTKGDLVSVFYRSNANQQWKYDGETGARTANLKRVDAGTATRDMDRVVVVYPYNEDYYINPSTFNVQASLPATQHYLANSYGLDGNIMISSAEYNDVTLKNVCGWLKLQLTGDGDTIKSIKFRGNDGEQVAGELYINSADATAILASDMGNVTEDDGDNATGGAGANLSFDDVVLTEVTLDCGEGVTLGKSATAFYIALPPQTFANGFTVEIEDTDGYIMEQSTANTFVVERNTISPMAALEFVTPNRPTQPTPANNEIWYTNGSTTEATTPYNTDAFGANIVSNTYDAAKECWVIKFDGKVTTIGYAAFGECYSLTSATIPDSVTEIGYAAFAYCSSLTSVTIPDSVTTIGTEAFQYCSSLQEFKGKFASDNGRCLIVDGTLNSFAPAGLSEYTIPNSVTTIGNYAFYYCDSLTSVTIPDSVTSIGIYAFEGCSSLTSVTIPDSVTEIGRGAFFSCTSLKEFKGKYATEDGRSLIVDNTIIAYANDSGTTYTIPDSVTTIGSSAFSNCSNLTSVTIGDSVTTIGDYAFQACSNLTSVTIPNSVTTIGEGAFSWCESLSSVTIPDSVTSIGNGAFYICSSLTSVYCKATTPPVGGSDMFYNNASGRKIYVPMGSVNKYKSASGWSEYASDIVGYNFENGVAGTPKPANNEIWYTNGSTTEATTPYKTDVFGANIVSNTYDAAKECWVIKFDGKVTTIGYAAFGGCYSLTSATIPDSVTTIGEKAFNSCSSLTSVTIPDSVTEIGYAAFAYCSSLTSVIIPDSVTTIGWSAFAECDSLTSVTIPDSVTAIGNGAFVCCSSLQEFKGKFASDNGRCLIVDGTLNSFAPAGLSEYIIPDSVTEIGYAAFQYCSSLTSVTIPGSVTTIGDDAFYDCRSLQEFKGKFASEDGRCLIIDGTLNSFAPAGLTEYTIPDSVTTIGNDAFAACTSLTSITIPDSVTSIGIYAFYYCESLTSVTIPDSVTEIGHGAFAWCSSLTSVTIPDSVTSIGIYAFHGCGGLTSITIPDSVTTIGEMAFYSCSSLTSVYCKAITPPAGGSYMFDDNASGRTIYVPTESVEAYKSAEWWSDYKSSIEGYNF